MHATTTPAFRSILMAAIGKLGDPSSLKIGINEIRQIMRVHIINGERMNAFITIATDFNESMKPMRKVEAIKLFGLAGEMFEETIVPFVPKIIDICVKKSDDSRLHQAISDSIGVLCHFVLKSQETVDLQNEFLQNTLEILFKGLPQMKKFQQIGTGMMLTRIIQNCPSDCLNKSLRYINEKLMENLKSPNCRCLAQIFECVIFIVLEVGAKFQPYSEIFLRSTMESINHSEWQVRKMAIDTVFTFANFLPDDVALLSHELLNLLKSVKIDKIKHVREAALEAIQKIKTITEVNTNISAIESPQKDIPSNQKEQKIEILRTAKYDDEVAIKNYKSGAIKKVELNDNNLKAPIKYKDDDSVNIGVVTQEDNSPSVTAINVNTNKSPEERQSPPISQTQEESKKKNENTLLNSRASHNSIQGGGISMEDMKGEISKIIDQQAKLMETISTFQKANKDALDALTARVDKIEMSFQQIISNRSIKEEAMCSPSMKERSSKQISPYTKAIGYLQVQ